MDELAVIHAPAEIVEYNEPVAENNFNRKKMLQLERGLGGLQKSARQATEVVAQIENGMKAMISETDLRRAIGLAFQEFEHRLEDAFQDSNRKCLSMFSKREEVTGVQAVIEKKVNWHDHNLALKRLAELKQQMDTMANDIFIGHLDDLRGQFSMKADKETVDQALSLKADNDDVNEVRARLERLETLVARNDDRQTAAVEALREETQRELDEQQAAHTAKTGEIMQSIDSLASQQLAAVQRLQAAEAGIKSLEGSSRQLREELTSLQRRQQQDILPRLTAMQEQLTTIIAAASRVEQDVRALEGDLTAFRGTSQQTFKDLWAQVKANKDHVEFLLQETDMIKRRSAEMTKKQTARFKDVNEEEERLAKQLQDIDGKVKKQARDVRAIENRASRAAPDDSAAGAGSTALAGLRALAIPAEPADPNAKLANMLEQLERLANGGPSVPYNHERPPLRAPGATRPTYMGAAAADSALPHVAGALVDQVSIDSARGAATAATVRNMQQYGLSPRVSPGGPKKKNKS